MNGTTREERIKGSAGGKNDVMTGINLFYEAVSST